MSISLFLLFSSPFPFFFFCSARLGLRFTRSGACCVRLCSERYTDYFSSWLSKGWLRRWLCMSRTARMVLVRGTPGASSRYQGIRNASGVATMLVGCFFFLPFLIWVTQKCSVRLELLRCCGISLLVLLSKREGGETVSCRA